jgi:hypothetical protein
MASDSAPHLNYMTDAAHLLAFTAPQVSAFIMSRRSGLMFANELHQSETQRQHVCGACGHIMILGQNSSLELETEKSIRQELRPRNGHKPQRKAGPSKVFTCNSCSKYTRIQLPPPAPVSRKKPLRVATISSKPEIVTKQPPTANASSKRRAKNRKAGLQALLNQSGAAKTGLGLSLSDFIKK